MALLLAGLTAVLTALFLHDWAAGYHGRALRKAGAVLLKIPRRRWWPLATNVTLLAIFIVLPTVLFRLGMAGQDTVFLWTFLVTNSLLPLVSSQAAFYVCQRGLVLPHSVAFVDWRDIRYCKWIHPGGELLVQMEHGNTSVRVPDRRVDAVTGLLACRVELRDPLGDRIGGGTAPAAAADERQSPELPQWQFTLRTLCLLTLASSAGASWLGVNYRDGTRQQTAWSQLQPLNPQVARSGTFGFKRVRKLDFSPPAKPIGDEHLAAIGQLSELVELSVPDSSLTDEGLVHLAGLDALDSLDLSGTAVSDAGLAHLARLRQLRYLNVQRTRVTEEGIARFRQQGRQQGAPTIVISH